MGIFRKNIDRCAYVLKNYERQQLSTSFLKPLVGFVLTLSQALVFTCLQYKSFEYTVGKGEIARKEQFLLFPQCFLPI